MTGHKLVRIAGGNGAFFRAICECGKICRTYSRRSSAAVSAHEEHVANVRVQSNPVDSMNPATWPDGKRPG